jgi:hypothetical protein
MELLALWLIVGVFTGVIAGSKNRSGFGWFLLGICFSLIALVAVAAMPALPGKAAGNAPMKTESPKVCPDCKASNSRAFRYCSQCGGPL